MKYFKRSNKRGRKRPSFWLTYVLLPSLVVFQIRFLTRNLKSVDVNTTEKTIPGIRYRRLNESQQASNDVHELLDRLKREREEIESQKVILDAEARKNIMNEIEEPNINEDDAVEAGDKVDEEKILNVDEVIEEGRTEFDNLLGKLRDELYALAFTTAEKELLNYTKSEAKIIAIPPIESAIREPPPNQSIDFLDPILSPPKLRADNTTTIILVPSHQGSFVKRQAIRETWMTRANQNSTCMVLFVVAQSDCKEFDSDLSVNASTSNSTKLLSPRCDRIDNNFLKLEQERNQDLLEIPMKEEYRRLPEKMMQAYSWVVKNVPNLKWVAKADDDMFVDVRNLELYIRKYNPEIPIVIGEIIYHSLVAREGKWAEYDYENDYYPYWPKGSAGHVLSRATLDYFMENFDSLHRYQGEDVSIGIWLDEAHKSGRLNDLTWIHAPENFVSEGNGLHCETASSLIMVGHEFSPGDQMLCHEMAVANGALENVWHDAPSKFREMIQMGFENY